MDRSMVLVRLPLLTGVAALLLSGCAWGQGLSFYARRDYLAGNAPEGVAIADLNHEGVPDVVVADGLGASVGVLLGDRNGSFAAPVTYPLAQFGGPNAVAVADFNGDGRLDVATNDFLHSTISIFFGNGDGTLQAVQTLSVPSPAKWLATSDVNHDSKADLILAASDVIVLEGNGDGTFQPPISLGVGPAAYVAQADFNHDGHPDIAALAATGAGFPATLFILMGAGNGQFKNAASYSFPQGANAIALGDVNADKNADVVATNFTFVSLLLGNGDGTFRGPTTIQTPTAWGPPSAM